MEAFEGAARRQAESSGRRATVIGAGIAGLAAALRLRQQGWDVVVVERAPSRRSSGYLVNLHGPGYAAAERLGLLPALTPRDIGFFTSVLVHADGRRSSPTAASTPAPNSLSAPHPLSPERSGISAAVSPAHSVSSPPSPAAPTSIRSARS